MNTFYLMFQQTLMIAVAIAMVALGAMFAERSGVINIAMEGVMVFGAFFGTLFISKIQTSGSLMNPQVMYLIGIAISAVAGVIVSLLLAFASINLKADQTIGGTAINMFIPAIALFIARTLNNTQNITYNNTYYLADKLALAKIPVIGDLFFKNTYISIYVALLFFILVLFIIYKTRLGLRLISCGEHPQAADSVGINVHKMRYIGVIISGILGGIGGYMYVTVSVGTFNCSVNGYGFLAIAVMIFGQWKPEKIIFAALFFAFFMVLGSFYTVIPFLLNTGIPGDVYKMLPYIATLVILAFTSKKSRAPKAEGIPYDKGQR